MDSQSNTRSIKPDQTGSLSPTTPSSSTTMSDFVPGTDTRPNGPPFPYRNQPYKAFYIAYLMGKATLLLPCWAVSSIPKSWRQSPNWSWTRSMGMRFLRMTDSVLYQ